MKRLWIAVLVLIAGCVLAQTKIDKPWAELTDKEKISQTIYTNGKLRTERDALRVENADLKAQVDALKLVTTEPGWYVRDNTTTDAYSSVSGAWYSLIVGTEPTLSADYGLWDASQSWRAYYGPGPMRGMPELALGGKAAVDVLVRVRP